MANHPSEGIELLIKKSPINPVTTLNPGINENTSAISAILSIQERGIDFQRERFLIRLSTDFLEMSMKVSVESP